MATYRKHGGTTKCAECTTWKVSRECGTFSLSMVQVVEVRGFERLPLF